MTTCPTCGHALTKTRGTRLPEDWFPTAEQIGWAQITRVDMDIQRQIPQEIEKFRDYWHAKPGKDGVKLDWAATWRNWIRNARATPQSARTVSPACHAPAPREGRKPQTVEELAKNQARLAELMGGMR